MAKFVIIVGPQAVGKMTVGQELSKITNLKFMHNHDTIELPVRIFGWESPARYRLTDLFRKSIFEEVAKSDLEGLIFTLVWAFDLKVDWDWIENVKNIFEKENGEMSREKKSPQKLRRLQSKHRTGLIYCCAQSARICNALSRTVVSSISTMPPSGPGST